MLKGKNYIITGCNRGIGKATMTVFAKNGANIWACMRKESSEMDEYLNQLQQTYNVIIWPIYFDITNEEAIKKVAKDIKGQKITVDGIVNNLGVIHTALFQMTSMETAKELFDTNYFYPMLLTQYILKLMIKNKSGSIINISSSAAIECNEGRSAYASSKAAIIATSKVMAKELGNHNIRVNAIAPGLTMTDMMKNSTPEDVQAATLKRVSLGRIGVPEEIANTALFLASDLSSYMTGQVLRVDGGM